MSISKLLLIDAGIVLITIPLLISLQGKHKKSSFFKSRIKNKRLENYSINLPSKENLLKLEKIENSESSKIKFDSILGNWYFSNIWKEDSDNDDSLLGPLLRVFSASLELKKFDSINDTLKMSIITSIKFGLFTIEFCGFGYLKNKQRVLTYFFNVIQLKSGKNILFRRSLIEPEENNKPFFKFITLEKNKKWLSARIPKGDLILWRKDLY